MGTFERETGMTDDENTINPHDLLKDGIFQSESAHDPEFDALKEAIPLLNHPLAPQNMQELAFDKAIFDLFVRDIALPHDFPLVHNATMPIVEDQAQTKETLIAQLRESAKSMKPMFQSTLKPDSPYFQAYMKIAEELEDKDNNDTTEHTK